MTVCHRQARQNKTLSPDSVVAKGPANGSEFTNSGGSGGISLQSIAVIADAELVWLTAALRV